jgi:hypothetical protein
MSEGITLQHVRYLSADLGIDRRAVVGFICVGEAIGWVIGWWLEVGA